MVGIAILNSVFGMRDFFFFFYKRKKIFFGQLIRLDCSPGAQNHNAERYIRLLLIFLEEFCFPYYTFLVSAETTPFNSFLTLNFVYFSLSLSNFRINNNFMFILAFLFFLFIFFFFHLVLLFLLSTIWFPFFFTSDEERGMLYFESVCSFTWGPFLCHYWQKKPQPTENFLGTQDSNTSLPFFFPCFLYDEKRTAKINLGAFDVIRLTKFLLLTCYDINFQISCGICLSWVQNSVHSQKNKKTFLYLLVRYLPSPIATFWFEIHHIIKYLQMTHSA